ncbi:MAG: hypothetical protein IPM96_16460 [Ignavibacteria bacterium]|nr:hypothetical protein [Ignavibacteria bacterium]
MKSIAEKEKFIQLRAEGNSFDRIADDLKISKPTLINWNIEFKKEIDNLEYLKYQSILEQHKLIKQKRIEFLSEHLNKINEAINNTNYEDLTIKDLIMIRKEFNSELLRETNENQYYTGIFETQSTLDFEFEEEIEKTLKLN